MNGWSPLRRADLADRPLDQLRSWMSDAGLPLTVATLCTVGSDHLPRARFVPVRDLEPAAVVIHTDLGSVKGDDLRDRPDAVCLHVGWIATQRQLRIDGRAVIASTEEAQATFAGRPRPAQIRAWVQVGDGEIDSRDELVRRAVDVSVRFGDGHVPKPPGWTVVRIEPRSVEVFQGAPDGCHDRFAYRPDGIGWDIVRLAP